MTAAARQRRSIWYSGQVQGVGFRYRTCQIASQWDVQGYVRNLPDGRVELVAEGAADVLDSFLSQVEQALARYIHEVRVDRRAATGEFTDFEVRA